MASQDWLEKDFYKVLGVDSSVTDKELTKKYHKLAHKYHPDSNPGNKAAETKFKEISEAYAVLSDSEQRVEYDQVRAMGAGGARFTAGSAGGFEDIFNMFGGGNSRGAHFGRGQGAGFEDVFSMFSGGGFGGAPAPGANIETTAVIDFITAIKGDKITVQTPKGQVKVRVPAGAGNGKKIRVRGAGEASREGGARGDLIITVKVRPHPVFERDGNNLKLQLPVTFTEAVFGATVEVPTLDGGLVKLKVQPGTPSGRILRVKGRGVQAKSGASGDLLAEVQVAVPQNLNSAQEKALREFARVEAAENPRQDLLARAKN
ncbi:DnaJ domain-containing protein [Canibacter sp. lx-72]|uniref:DnaJ C-terminal domain-containing protein n=1 Tax=Canibacter zhuwentaonis TaxID=2837491 RepID=UPI001BDBDE13|nr:DnaJ C-terminal domain-containing protein [Canibacter zhuwentaonis]MBT1018701.1 DnaJ domain-containing protein [Canibacter zhuwentaonis]MBT1035878.1 DnaJ domain-containing protein [Canibacter zhuwentaonis]